MDASIEPAEMPEEEDDGVENVDARNQSSANDPPPPKKCARFNKEYEVIKRRAGLGRECEPSQW